MPTDMTPEALDDAIAACRAPMLAILKDASFGSISAQRQKQNIERFDAAITALRARLAEVEAQLATARAALESAQESIAAFMGVHNYPIDSGAGDVLQQVSAALALIDQPAAPQPTPEAVARAALDILAERRRQVETEGWAPQYDDQWTDGQLALAAGAYALASTFYHADPYAAVLSVWPWDRKWLKPTTPRRDLVKAGALILAEIERLDRAAIIAKAEGRE